MTLVGALAAANAVFLLCALVFGLRVPVPFPAGRAVAAVGLAVAGAIAAQMLLGAGVLGLAAGVLPGWWRARALAGEAAAAEVAIVPALEAAAAAARSGLVLDEVVLVAATAASGELAERLRSAVSAMRLGAAPADALAAAADDASAATGALLRDLQLCARSRIPATHVAAFLDDLLAARRFERELRADIRARTAGQRTQVWILAAVVPALALYLSVMSPTLAEELGSPLGRGVLIPAAALFELGGIVASRRIVARACD